MRNRKYIQDRINHDRWLISYADFITLLFAFFVVMYALSTLNDRKYHLMSNSVVHAFGKFTKFNNDSQVDGVNAQPTNAEVANVDEIRKKSTPEVSLSSEREEMKGLAHDILNTLAPLIRDGKVHVTQSNRGISIDISDSVLFASGEAKLTPKAIQALIAIASILAGDKHDMEVEGYTDDRPISTGYFPSNWELSAVRAGTVVRLFIENGIAEGRLTAIGQGPKSPVGDNNTEEGRMRNRRVNVTILAMLPERKSEVPIEEPGNH